VIGAHFEISVDGKPRSYRDIKAVAIETAEFLKSKNPNSDIAARDLRIGEVTPVAFRPAVSARENTRPTWRSNAFVVIFHRAMAAARRGSASIDSWDLRRVLHRTFEHARTGR